MRPGLLDQFPDEFVSMRAAEKRDLRIMQDLAGKKMSILRRDVRQICDDEIERSIDIFEQFAFAEILFELEIKFHARASEHMCEQVLGVQARVVDVALLKIRGHGLQYLEDGHSLINGGTRTAASHELWG